MSVHRIAQRYAKSLLELAIEQGQLEAVFQDINVFQQSLESRDLVLLLKSPLIKADKKNAILDIVFKDKLSAITLAFFKISVRKGREGLLPDMAMAFMDQYRAHKNILSVKLTTASPIADGIQTAIGKELKESGLATGEIEWDNRVNPDLLGGFVLELAGKRYDTSVRYQLDEMRKDLRREAFK